MLAKESTTIFINSENFWWLSKFSFHHKWNKAWLLVINWYIRVASGVAICLKTLDKKWSFPLRIFFSKFDQIRSFLQIWSHLLKKSLIENFIFCVLKIKNLRKLENITKISKLHKIMSSIRNENYASTSKNLLKNRNWTLPVVDYFTWKLEFVSNFL